MTSSFLSFPPLFQTSTNILKKWGWKRKKPNIVASPSWQVACGTEQGVRGVAESHEPQLYAKLETSNDNSAEHHNTTAGWSKLHFLPGGCCHRAPRGFSARTTDRSQRSRQYLGQPENEPSPQQFCCPISVQILHTFTFCFHICAAKLRNRLSNHTPSVEGVSVHCLPVYRFSC